MTPQIADLKEFLDSSPCNFMAIRTIARQLRAKGFTPLDMRESWVLKPGGRHYVIKNSSAIFAFIVGNDPLAGYNIIAAHSDSPGFRIKPHAEMLTEGGILKLNTEVYGGPILYTWFDRPLSIAGRVIVRSDNPLEPVTRLIDFKRPMLTIPHLAIHYNRSVNDGNQLSRQKDMLPVLARINDNVNKEGYLLRLVADELQIDAADILDCDLALYDTTPACTVGVNDEFFTSGRIDDLSMAHAALTALTAPHETSSHTRVMAIFDNEETGSGTKQGAASPILYNILARINMALGADNETLLRGLAASFLISADNAHALHPNYPEKQDPTNHPILGGGPVIKYNANCKYMTDAESASVFKALCSACGVKYQEFVNHSDVAGGSTLGNILTSQIDLRGVDMGAPQWAMHSVRETAACKDHESIIRVFSYFYSL